MLDVMCQKVSGTLALTMKCQLQKWSKQLEIYLPCRINSKYTLSIASLVQISLLDGDNELWDVLSAMHKCNPFLYM